MGQSVFPRLFVKPKRVHLLATGELPDRNNSEYVIISMTGQALSRRKKSNEENPQGEIK